jgi:hypothetical protein
LKKECNIGITNDINYPFLKPFEILFNEGKPAGKINFQVLKIGNNSEIQDLKNDRTDLMRRFEHETGKKRNMEE